ncbi:MAG: acyl-CoA desaturase [Mycolicibacterium cosmeticum]|nr:acyl-CoA desaturase [Mycolicibacterium cosmeticum]
MAITDIAAYAKLSKADVEAFGAELDLIRSDVEESRGARDAAYIRRVIVFQRTLDLAARLLIAGSRSRTGWLVGTASLAYAKSVENMEIAHNVCHGQWDWMNDPEIHSTTWEWDMVGPSAQWNYSHNYRHHVFSNVLGVDDDLGFGVLRVTEDQPWRPEHLLQPLRNLLLATIFEWGIARHGLHSGRERATTEEGKQAVTDAMMAKIWRQVAKDYVLVPALSMRKWRRTLGANATANLLRNYWAYVVIFCGHFPDGVQQFTPEILEEETRAEWYLRQMLGAANFKSGRLLGLSSGNLCYQIEHHLFPDLPSNRYPEISVRVRELCAKYDIAYTTGSLPRQYLQTLRSNFRLALPDGGWAAAWRELRANRSTPSSGAPV